MFHVDIANLLRIIFLYNTSGGSLESKCSLLQTCCSVLCPCEPPCVYNIERVKISVMPVDQLRRQLGVRFLSAWYYTWPEDGTLTKRVVMNWCSFLGPEYSFFHATVRLNALKTLKNQNSLGLWPQKTRQGSPAGPKLQKQLLCKHFFPYKTQSSSTKRTLVKVRG